MSKSKRKGAHAALSVSLESELASENSNALMDGCHDYTERWSNFEEESFPPLPLTPRDSPAPKKDRKSDKLNGDNIIETLSKLINERADGLELKLGNRIETLEKKIDSSMAEVKELKENIDLIRKNVSDSDYRTTHLMNRVAEMEAHSRRWNLKLCGHSERDDEDARLAAIKICQATIPEEKDTLVSFIDVAHRLGPKTKDRNAPRPIIIRFLSRRLRDAVWKAAKTSRFLQDNKLRFTEDLCKSDREKRQLLWPLVADARKNGKKAYFVGGRAFIEGKEISLPQTSNVEIL